MTQRSRSQIQVESLEDRCTPSTSPFHFGSLFAQLESKLSSVFQGVSLPSLPSLPSHPSLSSIKLPSLPSLPSFPSLPSIPHVSLPSLPSLPHFSDHFESQLSNALQSAKDNLEHLHSQVDAVFSQLSQRLKDHFPWV